LNNQSIQKNPKRLNGWRLFNLISLAVTATILLAVVVGNRGVGGLLTRWGSLRARWTIAAVACMVGNWLLEGLSLHRLTSCLYRGVPFRSSMRTAMVGQLYSALTPFSSGGQPVELLYMQRDGLDAGGGASVLTIKSIVYQLGVILTALTAVICRFSLFRADVPLFDLMLLIGFSSNLLVALGMLLLALSPNITQRLYRGIVRALHALHVLRDVDGAMAKAQAQFDIYHKSTLRYEKKRREVLQVLVITTVQLMLLYLVPYMIYRAFGYREADVVSILSAIATVAMVSSFIPLPGGSGGAEGSFLLFFSLFFPQEDLLVALLLWRVITYYSSMVIGALVMMISRRRQRACIRLPLS
jgi:uncharacterized protein (TIRG00374 family)